MREKKELLELLQELGIPYKSYVHQPLNTVRDGEMYAKDIPGAHCKNLFVQDAEQNLFLVIILDHKRVDLKKLARQLNSKRLFFTSQELLEKCLGIKPGCVTPFALINDIQRAVVVLIDCDLMREEEICFHPLVNTETLAIKQKDFLKFIDYCGHRKIIIEE